MLFQMIISKKLFGDAYLHLHLLHHSTVYVNESHDSHPQIHSAVHRNRLQHQIPNSQGSKRQQFINESKFHLECPAFYQFLPTLLDIWPVPSLPARHLITGPYRFRCMRAPEKWNFAAGLG